MRLAFKIPGSSYGAVNQILRDLIIRQEWLTDGTWACVVEVPGGMKNELISKVANRASEAEVKELD
jgi:ribosome maturation protein Sdo1